MLYLKVYAIQKAHELIERDGADKENPEVVEEYYRKAFLRENHEDTNN